VLKKIFNADKYFIMKINDVISESVLAESQGGVSKRWLESQKTPIFFLDRAGNRYQFENLILLPNQAPVLPIAELELELETAVGQLKFRKDEVRAVNTAPAKQGAAMLVVMKDQDNRRFPFVKFFPKRTMDSLGMFWQTSTFEKETGLTWEQTRMAGTGKNKKEEVISRANLKPLFAVPTNTDIAISSVPAQAVKMLTSELELPLAQSLGQLLANILKQDNPAVPGLAQYERDIRVDFGEVASPIALTGNPALCTGSYSQVASELLAPLGVSWKNATMVMYPAAGNEPLYDSQLVWSNGTKLRISNKAEGKGGAASTVSILEVIDKYPERFSKQDKAMLAPDGQFGQFVTALRIIKDAKSFVGPVKLAIEFRYIDETDGEVALSMLEQKSNDPAQLTPRLQKIVSDPRIFDAKTTLPDYKVCYHAIASLARLVVGHLNQDVALTTEFFKFILARANLIQVNQYTAREGDAVKFSKFDVVWPPVFTGKIKFSASDFQSNKKPSSRLSFKT
jgi:hypothetical protein